MVQLQTSGMMMGLSSATILQGNALKTKKIGAA